MAIAKARSRSAAALVAGLSLLVLPACRSSGGPRLGWARPPAGSTTSVSYRPMFSGPRAKQLYLSNYAADVFGPARPRRGPAGSQFLSPSFQPPSVTVQHGTWGDDWRE